MVDTPVTVFAHLNAEKSALYRALLGVFASERARFTIALRPPEIAAGLAACHTTDSDSPPLPSETEITAALEQLVTWNNLLATRDTADVATVEEFYRSRYLYQFSAEGEAAEHAIGAFFQHLHRPGELQATTLHDLLTLLEQLAAELAAAEPDRDRVHLVFQALVTRFEELTSRAQSFMRSLQSTVELHGIELDAFFSYKDALIDHLDRFLGELVLSTSRITAGNRLVKPPARAGSRARRCASFHASGRPAATPPAAARAPSSIAPRRRRCLRRSPEKKRRKSPARATALRATSRCASPR